MRLGGIRTRHSTFRGALADGPDERFLMGPSPTPGWLVSHPSSSPSLVHYGASGDDGGLYVLVLDPNYCALSGPRGPSIHPALRGGTSFLWCDSAKDASAALLSVRRSCFVGFSGRGVLVGHRSTGVSSREGRRSASVPSGPSASGRGVPCTPSLRQA